MKMVRSFLVILFVCLFSISIYAQTETTTSEATAYRLPSASEFNSYVIAVMQTYPTNGTHQYYWPSSGDWSGITKDLHYRGSLFLKGDPAGRCFCCGLTFEVFFLAYEQYCKDKGWEFIIRDFDQTALAKFKYQWFGSDGNRKTLLNATLVNGMGKEIAMADAKPGDFVQLWRFSGSGHSVIFVDWERNANNEIIGLKYWSTQKSTNGIGYKTEYFTGTSGIDTKQLYIIRIGN